MKALIDGVWVKIPSSQLDNGDFQAQKRKLSELYSRTQSLQDAIPVVSKSLVRTSASATTQVHHHASGASVGGTTFSFYAMQGGCLNDTKDTMYYYIRPSSEDSNGRIVKATLTRDSTGVITSAKPIAMSSTAFAGYHGNDLTYHAPSGNLYLATMYQSGDTSRIDVISGSTLNRIKTVYAPFYASAIAYEPSKDLFVFTSGSETIRLCKLNDDGTFTQVKTLYAQSPAYTAGLTSQGICCDSAFIYHAYWGTVSRIEIFDWLGNYHGYISKEWSYEIQWIDKSAKYDFMAGFVKASNAYSFRFSQVK